LNRDSQAKILRIAVAPRRVTACRPDQDLGGRIGLAIHGINLDAFLLWKYRLPLPVFSSAVWRFQISDIAPIHNFHLETQVWAARLFCAGSLRNSERHRPGIARAVT
jgi:hypothetical protein